MKPNLSYDQLRRIICLIHDNSVLKAKLDEFLAGSLTTINETDLLGLIATSEIDKDMIAILSDKDPETLDALDGLEILSSFFAYIRANKPRLNAWLASIGFQVQSPQMTPSKPSK